MKFKKAYKEMTDEIHGDRALLHSILNGETKKKHSFLNFFSRSQALASALVCVFLVTTVFISYNKFWHATDSEINIDNAITSDEGILSKSGRMIDSPFPDFSLTNAEYYGDVLNRIISLTSDKSHLTLGDEERKDPLDISIEHPSEGVISKVTISRNTDLSSIVPNASYASIDGVYIAVSSQSKENEKNILNDILK